VTGFLTPVRCTPRRTPEVHPRADGRAALVLADAANESLKTGRTVRVDGW
jgi:hypothetical protein